MDVGNAGKVNVSDYKIRQQKNYYIFITLTRNKFYHFLILGTEIFFVIHSIVSIITDLAPEEDVKIKEKQDIEMTHNRLYAMSGARYLGQASVTMTENDLYESLQI